MRWLVLSATVVLGFVWLVCASRAGQFGGVVALAGLAILKGLRLRGYGCALVVLAGLLLVLTVAADLALGGRVRERAMAWSSDLRGLLSPVSRPSPVPLELVTISGRAIRLRTPAGGLEIRHDAGALSAKDWDQHELQFVTDNPGLGPLPNRGRTFPRPRVCGRPINGVPSMVVNNLGYALHFLLEGDAIRVALRTGQPVQPGPVETIGFAGRESLGSARGFIWSRSLPLLRKTWLVGFGPDTFAMVFPQHDFSGKFRAYGSTDVIVDKPHNFYLQTAINTGVLSLLSLVVLFVVGISSRQFGFGRVKPGPDPAVGSASPSWSGVAGYLVAACFNDSVVSVAPVFWVLLGAGIRTLERPVEG